MASTFQTISLNGQSFQIPNPRAVDWGQRVTDFLVAIPSAVLQPNSGLFTLTATLDLGNQYGVEALYFSTQAANGASSGIVRLANLETVSWRNFANNGNLALGVNSNDDLTWKGVALNSGASIVSTVRLTAQASAISSTTLYAVPVGATGLYRVQAVVVVTTVGTSGTISANVVWTDEANQSQTANDLDQTGSVNTLGQTINGGAIGPSVNVSAKESTNITYSTTFNTVVGSPQYTVYFVVERIA